MKRTSPATHYRAAATFVAAAVLALATHHASAQTVDLFGGTLAVPAAVTLNGGGTSTVPNFGPGYAGSVSSAIGAVDTLSETFAQSGSSNTFSITTSGVAVALGNTSATKTFGGVSLTAGGTYNLTLTRSSAFTVGALSAFAITLNEGTTQLVTSTNNPGLLGLADLLTLFASNNTATFQFTVPTNATGNLSVNLAGSIPVGVISGTDTFASAVINPVPEPRTVVTSLLGMCGLVLLRLRRRLRMA